MIYPFVTGIRTLRRVVRHLMNKKKCTFPLYFAIICAYDSMLLVVVTSNKLFTQIRRTYVSRWVSNLLCFIINIMQIFNNKKKNTLFNRVLFSAIESNNELNHSNQFNTWAKWPKRWIKFLLRDRFFAEFFFNYLKFHEFIRSALLTESFRCVHIFLFLNIFSFSWI